MFKNKLLYFAITIFTVFKLAPMTINAEETENTLNSVDSWIADRTDPLDFKIEDNKVMFGVSEQPSADSWYGWQGRKAYTGVDVSNYWKISYTFDITQSMVDTKNVNASMWIQVDKDGSNSAESQNDCVDWSIIQYINNDGGKWQSWNSSNSSWVDISNVSAEIGTYSIDIEFINGKITQYINNNVVNTYYIDEQVTSPSAVIAQGRSYGACFNVVLGVPTISTGEYQTIEINNNTDLINAIKYQKEGQTWIFTEAGKYDVATSNEEGNNGGYDLPESEYMPYPDGQMAKHVGPYVFPIYVDNLTIKKAEGIGEVIITSSAVAPYDNNQVDGVNGGGNWNWQSFMIISSSNVVIQDVSLLGNKNEYNINGNAGGLVGGQCDKIIETVDQAGNLTLRNVIVKPIEVINETGEYEKYNGTYRSGSIYFSHSYTSDKTVTLENVYTYGGIKSANNVNILIDGVTSDFRNNTYASYNENSKNFAWNPGIRGNGNLDSLTNVSIGDAGFTILVDKSIDFRQVFNDCLVDGSTVKLTSDVAVDRKISIDSAVLFDLDGHSLFASDLYVNDDNQPHLVEVKSNDVIICNGNLMGNEKTKHIVNVYSGTGEEHNLLLEDVTLDHSLSISGAPLIVNNSDVELGGNVKFITGKQSWYSINLDSKQLHGSANLLTKSGASISFEGNSNLGISVEDSAATGNVKILFGKDTNIVSPIDDFMFASIGNNGDGLKMSEIIINPQNANITVTDVGVIINSFEESIQTLPSVSSGYDDGGPFTSDEFGNVYDRWGNEIWHNPNSAEKGTNGYQLVNTSDL